MPFSESESMTIKRLEVALRKMDFQLLKDGAYKLHEKFHAGHKFEYIKELRQILDYINQKSIPPEISRILKTTIEDILAKDEEDRSWENAGVQEMEFENLNNLDALIANIDNPKPQQQPQMQQRPQQQPAQPSQTQYGSTHSSAPRQPFFEQPSLESINVDINTNDDPDLIDAAALEQISMLGELQDVPEVNMTQQEHTPEAPLYQQPQSTYQVPQQDVQQVQAPPVEQQAAQQPQKQQQEQIQEEESDQQQSEIAVFYDDAQSGVDFSHIKDYRNQLNMLFSKNQQSSVEYNLLKQIANITNIINTPIDDIDKILSTLTTTKNKVSFLSTSQSQNITRAFVMGNLDFEIPFVKTAKKPKDAYSIVPMLGFSNIFVCSHCNARNLKTDFNTKTLSVQCPECDSACFPDIYAVNSYNPDCNPIFWHRAFATLVRSKIWVLVNPPLDENKEIIFDFLKTAYQASTPKRIYLLSLDGDKREFYRQAFSSINPNCDLRCDYVSQEKLCEDFISTEIMMRVYG